MRRVVDAEGVHLAAILRAADFSGRRVLEVGCGAGRLTSGIAATASSVLAFDPKADDIRSARSSCPADMRERVRFEVASAAEIEVEPQSVDLVFFSWSL
ncbi:MAG: class I SAM-dependent methyltransferase [Gaiellaceae bacterium]